MRPYVIHPYITRTLNPVPDWKRSKCVLAILQSCVESYHETGFGDNFCPIFLRNLVQWNLSFGTPLFKGHPHSGDTSTGHKIWSRRNVHIIFVFVASIEETPLFRGTGHFFWVPKPEFNLYSGSP